MHLTYADFVSASFLLVGGVIRNWGVRGAFAWMGWLPACLDRLSAQHVCSQYSSVLWLFSGVNEGEG